MFLLRCLGCAVAFFILHASAFSQSTADFSIDIQPGEVTVAPGNAANFTIHVTSIGDFASPVQLQLASLSPRPQIGFRWGCLCEVTPGPGARASTGFHLEVQDLVEATYFFTIRGFSGPLERTVSALVRFERPKDAFTLVASSDSVVLTSGYTPGSVEVVITAVPFGRYDSPITVSCPGGPGMVVAFDKRTLAPWESTRMPRVAGPYPMTFWKRSMPMWISRRIGVTSF